MQTVLAGEPILLPSGKKELLRFVISDLTSMGDEKIMPLMRKKYRRALTNLEIENQTIGEKGETTRFKRFAFFEWVASEIPIKRNHDFSKAEVCHLTKKIDNYVLKNNYVIWRFQNQQPPKRFGTLVAY